MTSTVDPCETKPLATTLELFDTFKSQDDDKDSDEESFHLPLLGFDDEPDTEKENTIDSYSPNPETEDEILNKFDTNSTSEQGDAKTEGENLEIEKHSVDATNESTTESNDKGTDGENNELDNEEKNTENIESNIEESNKKKCESTSDVTADNDDKIVNDIHKIIPSNVEDTVKNKESRLLVEENSHSIENGDDTSVDQNNKELVDVTQEQELEGTEPMEVEEVNLNVKPDETKNMKDTNSSKQDIPDSTANINNTDMNVEPIEDNNENGSADETMIVEDIIMEVETIEDKTDPPKHKDENMIENGDSKETKDTAEEKRTENSEQKLANASENEPKEKQSGNDEECDDLLDISIIRDADEDNASAIAEITDIHSSDKSDNDEQDDKLDNEADEIEAEQEDNLLSSDKDDPIEFDEGNTNSSTNENAICEPTSDVENKDTESGHSENESQHSPTFDDTIEINSNQSSGDDKKNGEQSDINASPTNEESKTTQTTDLPKNDDKDGETNSEINVSTSTGKRHLSDNEEVTITNKKMRMSEEFSDGNKPIEKKAEEKKIQNEKKKSLEEKKKSLEEKKKTFEEKKKNLEERKKLGSVKSDKVKTLITFEKFMKNRNMGEGKLSRSDLEQFCLQKICEAFMHKTETGELHQTIKKQEQVIDSLRKDIQQLSKQTRDLDIVNKKLMNELRIQNGNQKPLVPLKITRSVGLQVKLNNPNEIVPRRKPQLAPSPRTPINQSSATTTVNRPRNILVNNATRQLTPTTSTTTSPRKTPAVAPILTQALQTRQTPPAAAVTAAASNKRTPVLRTQQQKPSAPGVIDLTDEDDRASAKTSINNMQQKNIAIKSINVANKNLVIGQNKNSGAKVGVNQKVNNVQPKTVAVGQVKSPQIGSKVGVQARPTVTTLPQSVRLTPAQLKNGIAIPGSVVTTSAGGTTQLMYVVQPSNASGGGGPGVQKAVLLNFQPSNGVLTSTLNGSAVSVIPSKTSNTMQLKTIPTPRKHPATLPLQPPSMHNSSLKPLLPKPHLSIRKTETGIILQWRMPYNLDSYEAIASYQLFAYQETSAPPSTDMWRKVGDVKALALPMACTLTQFADKNKYYFAVRSVDVHKRIGAFSDPEEISL